MTARLGFIIPSVNVVFEEDARRLLGGLASAHFSRVRISASSEAEIRAMLAELPRAAAEIGDLRPDAVCFACTGGSVLDGPEEDRAAGRTVAEVTGAPATTTGSAVAEALSTLGVTAVALATPYEEWLTEREASFLRRSGFKVVASAGLGIGRGDELQAVPAERIKELVGAVDSDAAGAVVIGCANLRSLDVLCELEQQLGKPVVTSNQAAIWRTARLAGVGDPIAAGGSLFRAG